MDLVVGGVPTAGGRAGYNFSGVPGALHDADNRIARMRSAEAMAVPSAQTIAMAKDPAFAAREPEAATQAHALPQQDAHRLVRT